MPSPNTERPPDRRRFWKLTAITLGAGTIIVGTVAFIGAWVFVNTGLTPLLERRLSKLLERELELGQLEALSWNGMQVGASALKATATDPTHVTADSVAVGFDLWRLIFQQELDIDLRLTGAKGYLEQHPEQGWLGIEVPTFEPPPQEPLVKVRMDDIDVVNGEITLVPLPADGAEPEPLLLRDVNGTVGIDPMQVDGQDSQQVVFESTTIPPAGGEIEFTGAVVPIASGNSEQPIQQKTSLGIKGEGVAAEAVMAFLLPTMGQRNFPMATTAGRVSGQWTVDFVPEQPVTVAGAGSVDNGQLQLAALPSEGPWGNTIDNIDVTARFKGTTITVDKAQGAYGELTATGTGTVDWAGDYDLVAQVPDIDLETLLERSEADVPIALSGLFESTVAITGPVLQPQIAADVVASGPVTIDRVVLNDLDADVVMQSDRIETLLDVVTVNQLTANPDIGGQITGSGVLNLANIPEAPPELDFTIEAANVPGDEVLALYDIQQLPFSLGAVAAQTTVVGSPADLATRINVQAPTLAYGGQVYPTQATAVFADGGLRIPQALVQVGSGSLTARGDVGRDRWQGDVVANNVNLEALGLAPLGSVDADVAVSGPLQGAGLNTIQALGDYRVQLMDGAIQGEATLRNGGWQTDATLAALGLRQFSPQLAGNTSGSLSLQGRLDALTLADVQAQGDLSFSAGLGGLSPRLAGFNTPLTTQFEWSSQELRIVQANSDQLQARGVVSTDVVGNQFRGIQGFILDVDADRYPLALLPTPVPLGGFASFEGRLLGTPTAPQLNGNLTLEQFGVNQVAFDPWLSGPISYGPQAGLAVDLAGLSGPTINGLDDGIALNFKTLRDLDFDVRWQGARAWGRTEGDFLRTSLQDLPLQALALPTVDRLGGGLQGTLSSQDDWLIDLARQTFVGGVVVEQPSLGYLNAQRLTGQITYRDRHLFAEQGELIFNACSNRLNNGSPPSHFYCVPGDTADSLYRFNGNVALDTLAYNANVSVENGDVGDVLTALAINDLQDLIQTFQAPLGGGALPPEQATQEILATRSVGDTSGSLQDQLRRLAEIQAIQDQAALAEAENPIPPLAQLTGRFDADVTISGRPQVLPNLEFDVQGQDWRWGRDFTADRVIAQGELADGILTLQPLRMETVLSPVGAPPQLAFANLAGTLSLLDQDSSGLQLVAERLPIAAVRDMFNLPLGLRGEFNAIANFSGSIGNPTVRGDVVLANGSINNQPIEQAEGLFLYEDARLLLNGTLNQVNNPQPLTLVGDIPYAFDFMAVRPADDSISLTIDVADEGLALLNVLNDQVSWESGKGRVSLDVGGRLSQPIITGIMDVQDAVLRSPLLPDPLTDFVGRIVFENDQIIVQKLNGNYGNGRLQAVGRFPLGFPPLLSGAELAILGDQAISPSESALSPDGVSPAAAAVADAPAQHPSGALTVTLDDIDLDLRGIYRGRVKGQVVVGGSLLVGGPQLGGVVELANGRVFLPDGSTDPVANNLEEEASPFIPRFDNLKITLAKNIQIQQSNLLNVIADGNLRLTGPLRPFRAIEPEGEIRLRSGRINLLTTTFRLAGRDNVARFFPDRGIADPFLDIRLRTSVTETQQSNVVEATAFATSEVADASVDPFRATTGLETIRIRANYQGTASKLLESLFLSDIGDTVIELSSSPPRSRQEIINLLSGSYVAALQSGQGVINFFGGALLTRLQDFIGRTLNLSEFRLFPVTGASRFSSEDNSGSDLDVATEIGFDVTNNVTLSILEILTDSTPTEFNLRYRLTDEFTLRGTTNFDDRNRVLLEFETRF